MCHVFWPLGTCHWTQLLGQWSNHSELENPCYAYALKPVKAPALWGIMLTICMSKMSSIIIGTQNCNSMDTVAEILHKVEIWSFTTILSVSTAYHTCQVVQDFSPAVSPMSWLLTSHTSSSAPGSGRSTSSAGDLRVAVEVGSFHHPFWGGVSTFEKL